MLSIHRVECQFFLVLALILICCGCEEDRVENSKTENRMKSVSSRDAEPISSKSMELDSLLRIISDKNTEYTKLIKVVQQLGPVRESSKFWSDIANSKEYTKRHRRVAVFELIKRHVTPGMYLSQLTDIFDKPTWLENRNLNHILVIAATVPLKKFSPGTLFSLKVLPGQAENRLIVYWRISGDISRDDFLKVMWGQDVKQCIKDTRILEVGLTTYGFGDGIQYTNVSN